MIDLNHPAVEAAATSYARTSPARTDALEDMSAARREQFLRRAHQALTAAIPHLTTDDLSDRLVRDIQVRTLRAAARAVTYEEDGTPWGYDLDRTAVWALLNELADNMEEETE